LRIAGVERKIIGPGSGRPYEISVPIGRDLSAEGSHPASWRTPLLCFASYPALSDCRVSIGGDIVLRRVPVRMLCCRDLRRCITWSVVGPQEGTRFWWDHTSGDRASRGCVRPFARL